MPKWEKKDLNLRGEEMRGRGLSGSFYLGQVHAGCFNPVRPTNIALAFESFIYPIFLIFHCYSLVFCFPILLPTRRHNTHDGLANSTCFKKKNLHGFFLHIIFSLNYLLLVSENT